MAEMHLADTHTHLYSEQFNDDRSAMVQRAIDAGVTRLFLPNVDKDSIEGMLQLTQQYPDNCFAMMGLHPCSVAADVEDQLKLVHEWLFEKQTQRFYAVGEIGLDYFWDNTYKAQQQDAFRRQIGWAKELGLPIVVHCRDAMGDILDTLEDLHDPHLRGILHCFTGTIEDAHRAINLGFYLGIGGVVTFKNSGLDAVVSQLPLEKLVLETDAPYLAPVPYRGKRNESAYLRLVADKVADCLQTSRERVADVTSQNAVKIFGK